MSLQLPTVSLVQENIDAIRPDYPSERAITLRVLPDGRWWLACGIQTAGPAFAAVASIRDRQAARKLIQAINHQAIRRVGGSV